VHAAPFSKPAVVANGQQGYPSCLTCQWCLIAFGPMAKNPAALAPILSSAPLSSPLTLDAHGARRLRDAFLAGRNENTRRAYAQTAADFAAFLSRRAGRHVSEAEAIHELLARGAGAANLLALDYRADLLGRDLASGTAALRVSNLRALVKLGRTIGMVEWTLEVASVKVRRYRDTSGPGVEVVRAIADHVRSRDGVRAARDRALLALLYGQGLRRAEAVGLDVEHVDLAGTRIAVLGKGRMEREWVALSPSVAEALRAWLAVRPGEAVGALLIGWDGVRGTVSGRLSGRGVAKLTARWGLAAAGERVRPHGLRHGAVTALLDAGLTWAEVAGFTRHADPSTLRFYDDNRKRRGNKAAARLAELVSL
jgi:integrase/recombinase XerC